MKRAFWGLTIIIFILGIIYWGNPIAEKPFFDSAEYTKLHPLIMASPSGQAPQSISRLIKLTRDLDVKSIRKKRLKVAVAMHDTKNDWSQAVIDGLKQTLSFYNVELIAITNGEFKTKKQIIDLKNLIELKPDVIITLPLDAVKMVKVYREILENGMKLIFLDSVPQGFAAPNDYISLVIGDSRQLGMLSAQSLVDLLEQKGKVALLNWKNRMFTVDQRTMGARDIFSSYKDIEIVSELSFTEFYEIPDLVTGLLKKHPDLSGLWTVWDTPAFEAIKAIRKMQSMAVVSTVDMNTNVAASIYNDSFLKTAAVDHPYLMGIASGILTILESEKIEVPNYVVIHADVVTKSNLQEKWQEIYRKPFSLK